jgi:hypothetical protein
MAGRGEGEAIYGYSVHILAMRHRRIVFVHPSSSKLFLLPRQVSIPYLILLPYCICAKVTPIVTIAYWLVWRMNMQKINSAWVGWLVRISPIPQSMTLMILINLTSEDQRSIEFKHDTSVKPAPTVCLPLTIYPLCMPAQYSLHS